MKGYQLPNYLYRASDEQRVGRPILHDVVVVGAGLTGLTAALSLGQRGLNVVVLDDDNTVGVRGLASRGVCYARRSLQVFKRLGVYERIAEKGVVWNMARIMENDRCLYEYSLPVHEAESFPPFVNIQQYYVEQFLVDRIADFPNIQIRWKNTVKGVSQDAEKVRLNVDTPDGPYEVNARWVVACDGAQSAVRNALDIQPHISTFDDTWLIVDFELKTAFPHRRVVWIESEDNAGRAVWFHPMADNVWRLDYQIGKRSDADHAAQENIVKQTVEKVLTRHFGLGDIDFELVWVGPWTYRTYVLDSFFVGRVAFAGDAAHLKSPFGARGGNSGIQDAENLAWKLEHVIRGQAPRALLNTYSSERREAAIENVRVTTRTARFLTPRTPQERRMRQVVQQLARTMPFARMLVNGGRMSEANRYNESTLCRDDVLAPLPDTVGIRPGESAVDARVRLGNETVSLVNQLGGNFKLLCILEHGVTESISGLLKVLDDLPLDLLLVSKSETHCDLSVKACWLQDAFGDVRARYGNGLVYLIRPDCYVGWRSLSPDAQLVQQALHQCSGAFLDNKELIDAPL